VSFCIVCQLHPSLIFAGKAKNNLQESIVRIGSKPCPQNRIAFFTVAINTAVL
jgi:hypothetical protein